MTSTADAVRRKKRGGGGGRERKGEERRGSRKTEDSEDRAGSQGARGMMNIKAGQAVRVDSTLSARGVAPRAKQQQQQLSDQYFLCENHGRWRLGRERG